MTKELLRLCINGEEREVAAPPQKLLLDVLREDLGLTGSKRGCDDSSCGCCAVLANGMPILACVAIASCYQDCEIVTVEGIAPAGGLHPVQEGYADANGAQCGYCTPGFLISTKALLDRIPNPTLDEIRDALSSNLCRCTGYMQIYESVKLAVQRGGARAEVSSGAASEESAPVAD
jgi:aerobic-type carbon monoxide dehydrogenase small subunit (CoxS/CutS family)